MKKTLMTMTLMTSALAVGFGAVAVAQDAPMKRERGGFDRGHGPFPMMMDKLDLNSDGEITAEEIEAHDAAMFAEMDADGDGVVTGAEMTAHHDAKREEMRRKMEERRQAKMIEHLDQDGDGVISAEEFASRPKRGFDMADTNGDGVIDADEIQTAKEKMGKHKRGDWKGKKHSKKWDDRPDEQE